MEEDIQTQALKVRVYDSSDCLNQRERERGRDLLLTGIQFVVRVDNNYSDDPDPNNQFFQE